MIETNLKVTPKLSHVADCPEFRKRTAAQLLLEIVIIEGAVTQQQDQLYTGFPGCWSEEEIFCSKTFL